MRIIIVAAMAALVSGGAALGQEHGLAHPDTAATQHPQHGLAQPAIDAAHQAAIDAKQRKQCKAMFGEQLRPNGQAVDRHGHMPPSKGRPRSASAMKTMHEKCEALALKTGSPAPKP